MGQAVIRDPRWLADALDVQVGDTIEIIRRVLVRAVLEDGLPVDGLPDWAETDA